jgi:hypothetical protein
MSDALKAKVAAVNRCHAEAMKLFPQMVAIFAPLVGQKLDKVDGGLLEKIKKLLPEFPNTHKLQIFRGSSSYSLYWTVKTCEMIGSTHTCCYHEIGVYIGNMNNGVLTSLHDSFSARSDYTVDEVAALRVDYKAKKKAADEAHSALSHFGEYDR